MSVSKPAPHPMKYNPHKEDLIEWFDERLAIVARDRSISEREVLRQTVKNLRAYCIEREIKEGYMLDAFTERRDVQYQLLNEVAYEELDKMRARLKEKARPGDG